MQRVTSALESVHRVGPTTSKMFLVTTHLRYPHLNLCAEGCQV